MPHTISNIFQLSQYIHNRPNNPIKYIAHFDRHKYQITNKWIVNTKLWKVFWNNVFTMDAQESCLIVLDFSLIINDIMMLIIIQIIDMLHANTRMAYKSTNSHAKEKRLKG